VTLKQAVFYIWQRSEVATVTGMVFRVLVVDDERQTLASLEASLASSVDDVVVHRVQPGATDQAIGEDGYDVVVTRHETYETGGRELIDRIGDADDGAVSTNRECSTHTFMWGL
jgi:CheY-like chemotaxis protein